MHLTYTNARRMNYLIKVIALACAFQTISTEDPVCPDTATVAAKPCNIKCTDRFLGKPCLKGTTPGCQCKKNLFLNQDGACVVNKDCEVPTYTADLCPNNLLYTDCAPTEVRTCININLPRKCTKECLPGCNCPKGAVYDASTKMCKSRILCADSPEDKVCKSYDPLMKIDECKRTKTCDNSVSSENKCQLGCNCLDGYVLNKYNKCVIFEDC